MRATPATIRARPAGPAQPWWPARLSARGRSRSAHARTPKPRAKRARRRAGKAKRASAGRWTLSWFGPKTSARDWHSKTPTCTTPSSAKCSVSGGTSCATLFYLWIIWLCLKTLSKNLRLSFTLISVHLILLFLALNQDKSTYFINWSPYLLNEILDRHWVLEPNHRLNF